jgi:hypothetical protein
MNKDTLGSGAFEDREPVDPLAPVTRGLEFIADHQRPCADDGSVTPEARDVLRRLAGQVIIVDDLPERVEVDPELRASVHPYPPIRSERPLPSHSDKNL